MKEAEQDLKLTEMNIKEKALTRSSLGCKWTRYLFEEERYKQTLVNQLDLYKKDMRENVFKTRQQNVLQQNAAAEKLISVEIERLLKEDATYLKLKNGLNIQEDIIRLIIEIQKQVSMLSYDISNSTNILKLEQI